MCICKAMPDGTNGSLCIYLVDMLACNWDALVCHMTWQLTKTNTDCRVITRQTFESPNNLPIWQPFQDHRPDQEEETSLLVNVKDNMDINNHWLSSSDVVLLVVTVVCSNYRRCIHICVWIPACYTLHMMALVNPTKHAILTKARDSMQEPA